MNVILQRILESGETQDYELSGSRATIGRDSSNHVAIEETYVSARHAVLTQDDSGELQIEDCDSRNGTFLNSRQVAAVPQTFAVGDIIRIGYIDLKVIEKPQSNAIPVVPLSERKKSSGSVTTP